MGKTSISYFKLLAVALLLMCGTAVAYAEKTVADLDGKDWERYEMFRHLFLNGTPEEFYSYANEYAAELHKKGYKMLYYKLLSNKGFFALRHNQIYRAIQFAEALDHEVREDKASDYYYLATGLYGDIYSSSHDKTRGETYFKQALEEVGDRDVKFTMRVYLNLAEMFCLKDPQKSLKWVDQSIATAQKVKNIDYLSMSLAMKAYIHFITGDAQQFFSAYEQYTDLRNQDLAEFNHRYDNILEVARLAYNMDYEEAMDKVHDGNLAVDSSLAVIRIYALKGDLTQGLEAMKRRYIEMDSIYSVIQDANFNQLAAETSLMRSREEAAANKSLAKQLTNWLIGLTVVYLFVYIMGRRRLMRKIWAKNKDLRAALSRAAESDRMKSTFIQSMSHEIRTPLNAVSGFAEVICSPNYELSDDEKRDMQMRITSNVEQITSIINELLELSQSESEDVIPDSEKTDVLVNELASTVVKECKGKQKTGVELRFTTDISDNFKIRSNTYRLKNALTHLMDNAMKFTELGHVELRCEHYGDGVRFIVTDTGCGIKAEDQERIFETFQKVDDFKTGVGLGLPICRRLIRSLGGEVSLDATYTNGARFIITI
jgi:signal transduction histidine kinase